MSWYLIVILIYIPLVISDEYVIVSCWPPVCLHLKTVYSGLLPTFNQVILVLILSCVSNLYILYINPLSDTSFANILSHAVGCLFFLSVAFFNVQKFLSFIRSHLFIFAFVYFGWGDRSSDTTFICTEKPKKLCNSLYCDVCFILVVWNWIHISEVCLYILAIFTITLFLSLLLADSSVSMPAFMETESNKLWHNKAKFIDGVRGSSSRYEGEIEVPQR